MRLRLQAAAPKTKTSQEKSHRSRGSPPGPNAPSVSLSGQRMASKGKKTAPLSTPVRLLPVISVSLFRIVNAVDQLLSFLLRTLTEPEAVQPRVSSQGSNSSVLVSWTKPPGRVESYKVDLNRTPSVFELDCTNTSCLFRDLSAGRLYTAVVTTCSGPFNASSEFITNATCKYNTFVRF